MKHIVDFDETLINENSSEILEYLILSKSHKFSSFLVKLIFFSPFRVISDRLISAISRLFFSSIDLRLLLVVRLFSHDFSPALRASVVQALSLNIFVISKLPEKFYIASCGDSKIIKDFISKNNLDAELLVSSEIPYKLISIEKKMSIIAKESKFSYITDSEREVTWLKLHYTHIKTTRFFFTGNRVLFISEVSNACN